MIISRTVLELLFYFIIYSLFGWVVEVAIIAIKERRFRNRGFVSLPFCTMYGIIMNILVILWPNLHDYHIFKFVVAFIVFIVVQSITETLTERICHRMLLKYEDITPYNGQWKNLIVAILFAVGVGLFIYDFFRYTPRPAHDNTEPLDYETDAINNSYADPAPRPGA